MVQINNPLNNSFFRVDFGDFIADLSDGDNVAGNEPPLFVGDNFENRRNAADAVGGKVAAAVRDEAVVVKFDGASNVRPLPEYDIRAGIDGEPRKLDDVAPVFPIEDFGIERQVFSLFPFRAAVEHHNDDVGFLFGFPNQFFEFGVIVQFDGGKVGAKETKPYLTPFFFRMAVSNLFSMPEYLMFNSSRLPAVAVMPCAPKPLLWLFARLR